MELIISNNIILNFVLSHTLERVIQDNINWLLQFLKSLVFLYVDFWLP